MIHRTQLVRARNLALATLITAVALIAPQANAQDKKAKKAGKTDAEAAKIAKQMQEFYKRSKDYQASFKQVYTDIAAGESKTSFGRVYFKTPGMMRWDYYKRKKNSKKKAREKALISDGKVFWVYEHKFQQVFKRCLAESQLPTSLKFLLGQGNLLRDFHITKAKGSTDSKPILQLEPKSDAEKAKYKQLRFHLVQVKDPTRKGSKEKVYQVAATTIYDPYGNSNKITFSKVLVNKNLPVKGFKFTPPKNARVLNPKKSCK